MKLFVFLLIFLIAIGSVFSQSAPSDSAASLWTKELAVALNMSQAHFDNWSQGGQNSLAWQAVVNAKMDRINSSTHWSNSGKFIFGKTKIGDDETKKAVDEIKLESVFTYKLDTPVHPYVSLSAQTQVADGYYYQNDFKLQISDFMDPGYFRQAVGMNYLHSEHFKSRVGASLKQTVTTDYGKYYSDDPETEKVETLRDEFGLEWVSDLNWKFNQDLSYVTKFEIFSTFSTVEEIDVEWDNVLTAKISKYFNCTFNFKLFYDNQISVKRQIKQSLAMGVSYNFF